MKTTAILVLAALAIAPAYARAAPAPAWSVDKAASSVRFGSSFNGAAFFGTFRRWDANIRFDPKNLAGSAVMANIDVASATTGDADRDQALPTATFLAAAKFPRAVFAAHAFKDLGGGRYEALGTLTLRGVSKPLTLPFSLVITGGSARMTGRLSLNRLAFGVGQDEWKATTVIPASVSVTIAVTARRAK